MRSPSISGSPGSSVYSPDSATPRAARMPLATARRRVGRQAIARACIEALEDRRLLSFAPAVEYAANQPRDIDSGDFNADGHGDLVTANVSNIGVRLNRGDGTFADETAYPIGDYATLAVVVGDLNADGKLDLAASTNSSRISGYYYGYYGGKYPIYTSVMQLTVLMGNGDGTFTPSSEATQLGDGRVFSVELGDLDEDGDLDAALTNWDSTDITVLLGDGNGTFGAPRPVAVGAAAQNLSIADIDGDSSLDLVTVNLNGSAKVILGNGDGTFQPAQAVDPGGENAQGHVVGDVNGDGKLDLVVTTLLSTGTWGPYGYYYGTSEGKVNVLLGNGDGTFAAANSYWADSQGLEPVELADVDGDGAVDIVVASYHTGNVNVLHGSGDGTFNPPEAMHIGTYNGGPADILVADLNGDAQPDVATANYGSNTVSVFLSGYVAPPLPPSLSIGDATVTEGNAGRVNAAFAVSLSRASDQTVTVQYAAVADGLAVAGRDFDSLAGTLTFLPGETSKQIVVPVRGDLTDEYDETFSVALSSPANAQVADGQGTGTILDDDDAPTIVISDVSKREGRKGNVSFDFTVSLSTASEKDVSVSFGTADGTATAAGRDYAAQSGTLFFAAGQTSQILRIAVVGDRSREASETFFVNLGGADGAVIGDGQGVGTILDDDLRGKSNRNT